MVALGHRSLPLALMAAVAPVLAVPAPQSLVVVLAVAGLWAAVQALVERRPVLDVRVFVAAIVLAAGAALTALWSAEPKAALGTTFRLGALALAGACLLALARDLDQRGRAWVARGLAIGLVGAAILLLAEYVGPQLVGRLANHDLSLGKSVANRSTSLVVLLLLPAVLALGRWVSWPAAVAVALLALAGLAVSDNSTAKAALVLALAMGGLSFVLRGWLVLPLRLVLAGLVLAAPLLTHAIPEPMESYQVWGWQRPSAHHRLTIWRFVGGHIAEHPARGWGMDASRWMPGADDEVMLSLPNGQKPLAEQQLPLHPHNAALQVWLELGAAGALALAALLWVLVGKAARMPDRAASAAALATLAAGVVIANSSYGLWQGWWQAALWIATVLAVGSVGGCRET